VPVFPLQSEHSHARSRFATPEKQSSAGKNSPLGVHMRAGGTVGEGGTEAMPQSEQTGLKGRWALLKRVQQRNLSAGI